MVQFWGKGSGRQVRFQCDVDWFSFVFQFGSVFFGQSFFIRFLFIFRISFLSIDSLLVLRVVKLQRILTYLVMVGVGSQFLCGTGRVEGQDWVWVFFWIWGQVGGVVFQVRGCFSFGFSRSQQREVVVYQSGMEIVIVLERLGFFVWRWGWQRRVGRRGLWVQ